MKKVLLPGGQISCQTSGETCVDPDQLASDEAS